MKKAFYVILALLTIIGMVSCGGGGGTTTYTVTFNSNGGSAVAKIEGIQSGATITAPTPPSKEGNTFAGWYKEDALTNAWNFATDVVTGNITLYAKWEPVVPGAVPVTGYTLGSFTIENNDNQKGWATNGVDNLTTDLGMDTLAAAKYLVLKTKGSNNNDGFGGIQIIVQGDGNSWNWAQTPINGDWISYAHTADETVYFVIKLDQLGDWEDLITGTMAKLFIGCYPITNLGLQDAYLVTENITAPEEKTDLGTLGFITKQLAVTANPLPPIVEPPVEELIEKVTLSNASQVIYYFVLPSGKKWSDYNKIKADYMLETDAEFEVAGSARTIRLYGNYGLDFFQFNETTAGNKYAYATLDGASNAAYILAHLAGGYSTTLSEALIELLGECPAGGDWFTIEYPIDGSKKNGSYVDANKPADTDTGPFIFGLGIPGQDDKNTFFIKNVKLVGNEGTDDVLAVPLYITKDGYDYPAFSAYGTASGNGVDNLSRTVTQGDESLVAKVPAGAAQTVTITFNLNAGSDTSAAFDPSSFTGTKVINKGTQQIGTLPGATRSAGWIFGGWATTATGTSAIATTKMFDDDADLYAIWTYDAPEGTPIPLTLTAPGDFTATGNATVTATVGGYTVTYDAVTANSNYGSPNAWFQLSFSTLGITDLTKIKAISFDFTPIGGDVNGKSVYIAASSTAHGWANDDTYTTETISGTKAINATAETLNVAQAAKLLLVQDKVGSLTDSGTYFVIRIHADSKGPLPTADTATSFSITNIQLIPFAD